MAHCVNRSSPEFIALAEQSNINPIILAAKVSLWQEENGLDNFPALEDVVKTTEEEVIEQEASPKLISLMKELLNILCLCCATFSYTFSMTFRLYLFSLDLIPY